MRKLYTRYLLKEQSGNFDLARQQAAQSGVNFDKLPPEIQDKLGSIASSWQQNQQAYQDLSSREAQMASQMDLLSNQPATPENQQALAQLQNQLQSTRAGLEQVKGGMAELEAAGKEIEPVVTQMRDTGQATAPVEAPRGEPIRIGPDLKSGIDSAKDWTADKLQTAKDYWSDKDFGTFADKPDITLDTAKDWAADKLQTAKDYWSDKDFGTFADKPDITLDTAKDWAADKLQTAKDWAADKLKPETTTPRTWQSGEGELGAASPETLPKLPATYQPQTQASAPQSGGAELAGPPPAQQDPSLMQKAGELASQYGPEAAMAGAAGAAVLGAYKLYKQFFSKAARACANAPDKSECMQTYRNQGVQAAVNSLKRQAPKCGNDQKCVQKLQDAISRLESKLGGGQ